MLKMFIRLAHDLVIPLSSMNVSSFNFQSNVLNFIIWSLKRDLHTFSTTSFLAKYMKSKGLVYTAAGNLNCKAVFHIKSQKTAYDWEKMVSKCLYEAEHQKYKTISFPALGTGKHFSLIIM